MKFEDIFSYSSCILLLLAAFIPNSALHITNENAGTYQFIALLITAVIVAFYTRATKDLLKDSELRTRHERLPFLRLQWSDKSRSIDYIGKDNLEICTSLQLVNEGRGIAEDIRIDPIHIGGSIVTLKNVTAMKADHGMTFLRYMPNSPRLLEKESYGVPFKLKIKFKDYLGKEACTEFSLDSRYNDGFRIGKGNE